MITNLRLTLSKPHWRYKFLWLVLSLVVAGAAYGLDSTDTAALAMLSAIAAGLSMVWYALLVAAGAPARDTGGVVNSQQADSSEKRRVWLFSVVGWPAVSSVAALVLAAPLYATGIVSAAVLAVLAIMRVTDISRESCTWPIARHASHQHSGGGNQPWLIPLSETDADAGSFEMGILQSHQDTVSSDE